MAASNELLPVSKLKVFTSSIYTRFYVASNIAGDANFPRYYGEVKRYRQKKEKKKKQGATPKYRPCYRTITWMVCYNISRSISPCTTLPTAIPATSATMSFQHQWLPSVPSSCTSLATATTAATMGQMTARTRHTPKCFTLSLPVHKSLQLLIVCSSCRRVMCSEYQ